MTHSGSPGGGGPLHSVVRDMHEAFYSKITRYTTSAFMRLKLGDALSRRKLAPYIFETREEAYVFHAGAAG